MRIEVFFLLTIIACRICRHSVASQGYNFKCVTGYMTDVQSWVDGQGALTDNVEKLRSIDLSNQLNPIVKLHNSLQNYRSFKNAIKYLSLARCNLRRVPNIFISLSDPLQRNLAETLEYLTLTGNKFLEMSSSGEQYDVMLNATGAKVVRATRVGGTEQTLTTVWFSGFNGILFPSLKELDLRSCGIEMLSPRQFQYMPALQALYLSDNEIHHIRSEAFYGLTNLLHLDLSRIRGSDLDGNPVTLLLDSSGIFEHLTSLKSLDFSMTNINQRNIAVLKELGPSLEKLSLCYINAFKIGPRSFRNTSLRVLDLSGNYNVFSNNAVLGGIESTLEVLYASDVRLNNFDVFLNFEKLQVLQLNNNEITIVRNKTAKTLKNLKVLNLERNRINSWYSERFSFMKKLRYLDLSRNNINIISEEMAADFTSISYVNLAENVMLCSCLSKELLELASKNERRVNPTAIEFSNDDTKSPFGYHRSFEDIKRLIYLRSNISYICDEGQCSDENSLQGDVLLLEYSLATYSCFELKDNIAMPLTATTSCEDERQSLHYEHDLANGWNKLLFLLVIPGLILPILLLTYIFRKNLRYCYVTMKNSAMLSMVNKNRVFDENAVYNYDVFVSYCNEDRTWVLDQLLNNLEHESSLKLCLHERDFQVGLSILENIVSCLDRSKSIVLVISKQFLLSQWCQFEMHLAQHRLLETRREDLILILLEEIPRNLRPNTLHYLMLTKTYIVWPNSKAERQFFWKRLKKSIVTQKQQPPGNVTL